ncbi:ParB/RepB/Spo0J family partition protein [Kitasatospora arboriphila]
MLQSALAANTHREAVPELEEARAIQQLLDTTYQGNQAAVARALSKTPAWVGQRLALLHLTPEVQEMVETGELTVKAARRIGAAARRGDLTGEQQMEAARAATAPAKATAPAADVNPVYPPAAQAGAAAADGSAPVAGVNPVYSTTVADPSPESTGAAVRPEDVNPVYSRETAGEHTADSSQGAEDGPTQESVGDGGDVNPVYSDRQAAVPDQRAEAVSASLTLHLDLRDVTAAARTIRASVDARTALQLAGALLAIVQSEPGGKAVLQSIRHRNG